ncbi:MAG TPA: peptidoglycan DD-metalloendopeptidase family protein [Acidimicrobiia bacterium]|nr:peptidoglycan DD-metalloendopeptidase family protein [Acidimicrobiia bacterium]
MTSWPRRVATALALLALVLGSSAPAFSIDEEDVERARREAEAAARERAAALDDLNAAVATYEAINGELQELTFRMDRLRGQLEVYEDRSLELRDQIRVRAVESYVDGTARNDALARVHSPEEVQRSIIAREVLAIAVEDGSADLDALAATTAEMDRLRAELEADTVRVAQLRVEAEAVVARMNELFDQADDAAEEAEEVLEQAEAELEEQRRRERALEALRAALGAPPLGVPMWVTPGFVCPIDGPNWFLDTWGAPRSGGRTHKGTDMFAARGTPLVAVGDGIARKSYGSLGGYIVWLYADHGVDYFYAHLDSYAPGLADGQRVARGQVIGYVGDTGNPPPGAYHLHFGIYPGGITAVNPYPTVLETCG